MAFPKDQTFFPLGGSLYLYVRIHNGKVQVFLKHLKTMKNSGKIKTSSRGVCMDESMFKRIIKCRRHIKKEVSHYKKNDKIK